MWLKRKPSLSSPKKHHFVPQWYLTRFADSDGFLNIYDKNNGMWRRQKPKEVMHRNKYYQQSWAPDGIDPNILERKFGEEIEPKAKNAFEKLLNWEEDLTTEEWADIFFYVAFQYIRVPLQAEEAKELLRGFILAHGNPKSTKNVLEGRLKLRISDSFRFEYMRLSLGVIIKSFMRMEWEIVTPESSSFVTTDSPVTLFNPRVSPPSRPGLGLIGTVVFFPIRPDKLILMRHKESLEGEPDLLKQIADIDQEYEGTRVNEIMVWPREQVIRHNELMFRLADRTVASKSKDCLEEFIGNVRGH